ncbi:uncharacterized protein LOC112557548 [Pomacea canaliculata]|uniref:uncharacterized protein LOC112557548 n=1 Tax=Pomacea canaliculata TaxID=400727 RepID=UPI000D7294ED|nr:uncharacterized protein LOC112557548 [Pomacea canaliculata]
MAVYSSLWLTMAALVVTCVRAELSTAMPEEEALVLDVIIEAPKEAVYFLFDIKGTQLTSDGINKAFEGRPVIYKFKVLGGQRVIVVLRSAPGDRAALRDLVIPQATEVEVFMAESLSDFVLYDDVVGLQDKAPLHLEDENLYMSEFTLRGEGMNLTVFKNNLKEFFRSTLASNFFDARDYHLNGFLPFTCISFFRLVPHRLDRAFLEVSDFLGGPYQVEVRTRPIVNI